MAKVMQANSAITAGPSSGGGRAVCLAQAQVDQVAQHDARRPHEHLRKAALSSSYACDAGGCLHEVQRLQLHASGCPGCTEGCPHEYLYGSGAVSRHLPPVESCFSRAWPCSARRPAHAEVMIFPRELCMSKPTGTSSSAPQRIARKVPGQRGCTPRARTTAGGTRHS